MFKKYDKILYEEFIGGQEIQAAVINKRGLGAIELIPKRLFYDYKAKYTKAAKTKHVMPARLSKKYLEVLNLAVKAHKALGCKGVTRSDFKFYKNRFYLLEINTQPGMTNLSLVPEIANYCGISFINLVEKFYWTQASLDEKRYLIALALLILLSTYKLQNNPSHYFKFNIDKIYIEKQLNNSERKIIDKLNFLYQTNLFLLNTSSIEDKLSEIEFIESFEVKKIYPDSIQITIYEKEPIAILQNKKQKKYFTSNGNIVKFQNLERYSHLPVVFEIIIVLKISIKI